MRTRRAAQRDPGCEEKRHAETMVTVHLALVHSPPVGTLYAKAKCSCFKFPADKFLSFSWSRRPQAPEISPMPYPLIMLNLYRLFKPFLFLEGK